MFSSRPLWTFVSSSRLEEICIDNSSTNATCPPQTNSQSSGSRSRYGRHRDIGRGSGLRRQVEKIVREAETSFGDPDRDRNSLGAPDRDRNSLGSPDRDRRERSSVRFPDSSSDQTPAISLQSLYGAPGGSNR